MDESRAFVGFAFTFFTIQNNEWALGVLARQVGEESASKESPEKDGGARICSDTDECG